MIVYKKWIKKWVIYEGWFLLGFIPLYIKRYWNLYIDIDYNICYHTIVVNNEYINWKRGSTMTDIKNCIHVYSLTNSFIDFVIIPYDYQNIDSAKSIVSEAYDSYWRDTEASDMTMADWIALKLKESDIDFDLYFNEGNGESMNEYWYSVKF